MEIFFQLFTKKNKFTKNSENIIFLQYLCTLIF